ncbi:MAG: cadherin-like domain-containing protein [Candidatus Accumulibacter propinquus]|uniref:tandem-95 repeat protein n=1 Tax=Candidatus Accumulibacter propinquus TaxID=2954380 RepID=UPI002FC2C350
MPLPTDPLLNSQWHLGNPVSGLLDLNVRGVWNPLEGLAYTGASTRVFVIDNGFDYNHSDLAPNYNFALDYDFETNTDDAFGGPTDSHGTAVAGIIGAAANGTGAVGVAFNTELVGYRVYWLTNIRDAILSAGSDELGGDVMNISMGLVDGTEFATGSIYDEIENSIRDAVGLGRGGLGTTIVKSAGNSRESNYDVNADDWGNDTRQVVVAAVDQNGFVSWYSSYGAANLVSGFGTPGEVVTTDRVGADGYNPTDFTSGFNGTSSAAPMVTGVVALMYDASAGLGWRDVQSILANSARHVGSAVGGGIAGAERHAWNWNAASTWNGGGLHFSNDYGYGLVDALAAVRLSETWLLGGAVAQRTVNEVSNQMDVLDVATIIPDGNSTGLTFSGNANYDDIVERVTVEMTFSTTWIGDLEVFLTSPDGTVSQLIADTGWEPLFNGTWTFETQAFRGERAAGTWSVRVVDDAGADVLTVSNIVIRTFGEYSSNDRYVFTNEYSDYAGLAGHLTAVTDSNGGTDVVNASAVSTASIINLGGGVSTIDGIGVTFANIENAIGGDGSDSITGSDTNNVLYGMRGNDFIHGGVGIDTLYGGAGNDTLVGGGDIDSCYGDEGNDTFRVAGIGSSDGDNVYGGADIDTLDLGGWSYLGWYDWFYVTLWVDLSAQTYGITYDIDITIYDAQSIENVIASSFNDYIFADEFDNNLDGGSGDDEIDGVAGDDTIVGDAGNDSVYGGDGNDYVDGGYGDDQIAGQAGDDQLAGGAGDDSFVYTSMGNGVDSINDFADGDRITIVGTTLILPITSGDGAALQQNQVQVSTDSGVTTLHIGTDNLEGADVEIQLTGEFLPSQLRVSGSSIFYNHAPVLATPTSADYADSSNDDTFNAASGTFGGSDIDPGTTLSYGIAEGTVSFGVVASKVGSYGTLLVNIGTGDYTFTPNDTAIEARKSNDSETFSVTVSDGLATTNASFTVKVTGADDPTTFSGVATATVSEDGTITAAQTLTVSDRDTGDAAITPQSNTAGSYGAFSIGANGAWAYALNNAASAVQSLGIGQSLSDSFTAVTAGGATQVLTVTINGTNDAPTASHRTVTTNEDTARVLAVADFGFSDVDTGDTLQAVTVTTLPAAGSLKLNGVAVTAGQSISVADLTAGNLVFTPATNANGSGYASFDFKVSDGTALSDAAYTMTVNVTPVNDAPTASHRTVTTNEDTARVLAVADFGFSDVDTGDTLQAVTVTTLPAAGSLKLNGVAVTASQSISVADLSAGKLVFTPAANTNGAAYASFGFKVSDGTALSASAYTMTVNVTPVNDAPTASHRTVTTNEDTARVLAVADFGFSDVDTGDTLQAVTVTTLPAAGSLKLNGVAVTASQSISVADLSAGKLVFTPAANTNGAAYASFGFKVSDGTALSASAYTMTVNVTPVNDAPTASHRTVTTNEDTARVLAVADFGFSDVDTGDTLQAVTVTTLPAAGSLKLNGVAVTASQSISVADLSAGKLVFTPAANTNGAAYASFGFKVSDGTALSASAYTMTVNVTPVNDAPTASHRTVTTNEDTARVLAVADFGFSDVDTGDTLQAVTVTTLPAAGSLKLNGVAVTASQSISVADLSAGKLVFTPAANTNGAAYASFGFKVSDGTALSASAYTMTVNVTPVRDDLTLTGGVGNDTLVGDLIDVGSYDHLIGLAGNDSLSGLAGNDTLDGGAGNDTLNGGSGADSMTGGDGSDIYYVEHTGDVVSETNAVLATGGTDTVLSTLAAYTLTANVENGRIHSTTAANLTGNTLNNVLYAGAGNNVLNGGSGIDTVSYAYGLAGTTGVTVSLAVSTAQATGGSGSDTLTSIENLIGSAYADKLTGNADANSLGGGAGSDTLDGGAGSDTLAGGDGSDAYFVRDAGDVVSETNATASTGGTDTVLSTLAAYTLTANVENGRIHSTTAANLTGNTLNNVLYAGAGNNALNGSTGIDTVSYAYGLAGTSGVTVSLAVSTAQATGGSGSDTLISIENLFGSASADKLTGNSGANSLAGGAGNDTLDGGTGIDTLAGGDGSDAYYVRDSGDVVSETNATASTGGTDTVYSTLSAYTLTANVENGRILATTAANLTGNTLNNVLYAGAGNNVLNGGSGSGTDTVSYVYGLAGTSGVTISLAVNTAQATGGSGSDTLISIENLIGSASADKLTGNSGANNLAGGSGNDTLDGGAGNDSLVGGAGKDLLIGSAGNDVFDFNALSEMGITIASGDVISDFVRSQDKIDLSTLDADTGIAGDQIFSAPVVGGSFSGVFANPGDLFFDSVAHVLYGNTDADAAAEFAIQLTGVSTLAATDLFL